MKITIVPSAEFISKTQDFESYIIKPKTKIVHQFVLEAVKLGEAKIAVTAVADHRVEEYNRIGLVEKRYLYYLLVYLNKILFYYCSLKWKYLSEWDFKVGMASDASK